jgi:AraC-like DNA-binding protein
LQHLKSSLLDAGFELLEEQKDILVERIKTTIVELIHYKDNFIKTNFSEYISSILHYDYTYLANTFSEVKGTTIERYIIMHKVEKVKELLEYNQLSLTEISDKLNYSSVPHLSNQFKKITGFTITDYKKQRHRPRTNLEDL